VRYRVDGVVHDAILLSAENATSLIRQLKSMADLSVAEKRRPQEGSGRIRRGNRALEIRVSTLPTDYGERVTVRILDRSRPPHSLDALGLEPAGLQQLQSALHSPSGLILIAGPEGCGKTTTLYAALSSINRPDLNRATIEDPIELDLQDVNQTSVRPDLDFTHVAMLQAVLCQDANVILISELKDRETATTALRAARTGHLILGGVHADDAASALGWLGDIGIEPALVASSVKLVLAQRLVRRLCPSCRIPVQPTPQEIHDFISPKAPKRGFFGSKGCPSCHYFGYRGQTGAFETLSITAELSELISKGATISQLRHWTQATRVPTIREAALRIAERGETSLEEVQRVTLSCDI
jgi:type II secretory ATPase GspE/PulE/Tfp pilus assembly ATPase PilB-like protein